MAFFGVRYPNVDSNARPRRNRFRRVLMAALLVAAVAFLYLWRSVKLLELNYEVERNRRRLAELEKETTALTIDLYERRSLERVGDLAREKLAMRPPGPGEVVLIKE